MSQPEWELVANLGDVNPIEHGAHFVLRDKTGAYDPEAEVADRLDEENRWYVWRYSLPKCTYGIMDGGIFKPLSAPQEDGILSDNRFHPECTAWFAQEESRKSERPQDSTYLSCIADSFECKIDVLIGMFTSDDIVERALAYKMVADYHGLENFDSYPLVLTKKEISDRYRRRQYNEPKKKVR